MKVYDFGNLPDGILEALGPTGRGSFFILPEWYGLVAKCGLESGARTGLAVDRGGRVGLAFSRTGHDRILRSCTNLYTCEFAMLGRCVTPESIADLVGELASCF